MHTLALAVHALGPAWLNPETLVTTLGTVAFWVALAIIFAECGLLIGFFLPGDSLLFVVGLFIAAGVIQVNIVVACILLALAAFLGNAVGFWIGWKAGPAVFKRDDSRLFKRVYVERTHHFFERYGARAIILARFVPIVRTFITVVAGVGHMKPSRYLAFSAIGAVLWGAGVTILGYFLGTIPFIKDHIELIFIIIVVLSIIPIIIEYLRHRSQSRTA